MIPNTFPLTLILVLFFNAHIWANNSVIVIEKVEEFRVIALSTVVEKQAQELNRAIKEFRSYYPDARLDFSEGIEAVSNQLAQAGYLKFDLGVDSTLLKVDQEKVIPFYPGFESIKNLNFRIKSKPLLHAALKQREHLFVRFFAIQELSRLKLGKLNLGLLFENYFEEENWKLRELYFEIFLREDFYKFSRLNSKQLKGILQKKRLPAKLRMEKAHRLYLSYLVKRNSEKPELRTLMYCMDHGFPLPFLKQVCQDYPDLLEGLIPAFTLGYGDHTFLLFELLKSGTRSKKVLEALLYALENRTKAHFFKVEFALIKFFEQETKIPFLGSVIPYREWLKGLQF